LVEFKDIWKHCIILVTLQKTNICLD